MKNATKCCLSAKAERGNLCVLLAGMAMAAGLFVCPATIIAGEQPASTVRPSHEFVLPAHGLTVPGELILLAIDDHVLPLRSGLCYYLSKPTVRREPVLRPERENPRAPDQLGTHFYGAVLQDQGKFRMWYYAVHPGVKPAELKQGPVCYAESGDGLAWVKPALGQVDFQGSKQNNAIALPGEPTEGVNVIKDEQEPDPRRRYKMIYNVWQGTFTTRTAISADGIAWTAGPFTHPGRFIEQASFYKHQGYYFINAQSTGCGEGGRGRGRQGYVWLTADFDRWVQEPADAFILPEPANLPGDWQAWGRPYDQVHLGVGAASFGSVVVGLYGLWHQRGWGAGGTTCDFGLVLSSDGIHFREPVKGYVYLSHKDSPVTPVPGKDYPTILCQANGILNVGPETRIYHGRWRNAGENSGDYDAEVALATLPRDRWGALGLAPGSSAGTVWSAPITLPAGGCEILLNADGARDMRVELSDERFNLLPDYSQAQAGVGRLDKDLACPVTWPGKPLADLAGKTVRLRITLKKGEDAAPRLYAIYLRPVRDANLSIKHD